VGSMDLVRLSGGLLVNLYFILFYLTNTEHFF
jgi:hypothetical protein